MAQRVLGVAEQVVRDRARVVCDEAVVVGPRDVRARVDLGPVTVDTLPVDHIPGAVAMRIDHAGKRLVYTGDTRWHGPLVDFARDADLLVAEGHFSGSHPPGGAHMSPAEAGRLARASGARRLLLTHLAALEDGPSALDAAKAECNTAVELAVETTSIRL